MKVLLIGKTEVDLFPPQGNSRHVMPGRAEGSAFEKRVKDSASWTGYGQQLIEFAGRLCYESFDLPNKHTASNSNYVRSLIAKGHESVLEHVSVTFYVEGVSRNLSHELLEADRHLSFSELSQRFVNMEDARYVIPPLFRENEEWPELIDMPKGYVEKYQYNYSLAKDNYSETGKAARQAARYVLPGATETKFVVSGNLRAWRDVLKKRHSVHADAEMQLFAAKVLEVLSAEYPDVFADIEYQED